LTALAGGYRCAITRRSPLRAVMSGGAQQSGGAADQRSCMFICILLASHRKLPFNASFHRFAISNCQKPPFTVPFTAVAGYKGHTLTVALTVTLTVALTVISAKSRPGLQKFSTRS
jgi:hypothetical protein